MLELEYYLTTNNKWFIDLAKTITSVTGEQAYVEGHNLIFPPSVADGRYSFYELTDGLAALVIDCTFHKPVLFTRNATPSNDYFKILFNLSTFPVMIRKQSGRVVDIGSDFAEAMLFSSNSSAVQLNPSVNRRYRAVELIFHRSWGTRHFESHPIPLQLTRLQEFVNYKPMQFTSNLDLRSRAIVEDVLAANFNEFFLYPYLEGCMIQLFAIFFKNIVEEEMAEQRVLSDKAIAIIQLKEYLEKNIEIRPPSMKDAAKACGLNSTAFSRLFHSIYQKSYLQYIQWLKIQHGAKMLVEGKPVADIAYILSFSNASQFTRIFKKHFHLTPAQYARDLKKKEYRAENSVDNIFHDNNI